MLAAHCVKCGWGLTPTLLNEDNRAKVDLKAIYLTVLERCAPERLVRAYVTRDMPRHVVAIGKCAGAMLDGVAGVHEIESAFVAVPEGYRLPVI
jgi:glycerate-2-kinase